MTLHTQGDADPCFEAYLPIQCTTSGAGRPKGLVGKTRSVSPEGLEILLPENLPIGTPVLIQIDEGEPLRAHVVWAERGTSTAVGTVVPHGLTFQQPVDPYIVRQWVYRAERQSHERAPVQFPVEYIQAGTGGHGTCLNLSRGGMFISTPQPAPPGSQVALTFNLPNLSHTFSVLARVVWMRKEETEPRAAEGMGVEFLDPKPSQTALIGTVVDRFSGQTLLSSDYSSFSRPPR